MAFATYIRDRNQKLILWQFILHWHQGTSKDFNPTGEHIAIINSGGVCVVVDVDTSNCRTRRGLVGIGNDHSSDLSNY